MKILCESVVDNNIFEAIGYCECSLYDGTWLIEKEEKENLLKEYNLKRYWHS